MVQRPSGAAWLPAAGRGCTSHKLCRQQSCEEVEAKGQRRRKGKGKGKESRSRQEHSHRHWAQLLGEKGEQGGGMEVGKKNPTVLQCGGFLYWASPPPTSLQTREEREPQHEEKSGRYLQHTA